MGFTERAIAGGLEKIKMSARADQQHYSYAMTEDRLSLIVVGQYKTVENNHDCSLTHMHRRFLHTHWHFRGMLQSYGTRQEAAEDWLR